MENTKFIGYHGEDMHIQVFVVVSLAKKSFMVV
jgi:hypothetical protein